MAWITKYYIDLKLVDGSKPVKRRLVFYDRRTDTKLLTIPAVNIPDDGIVETEELDKTIPANQIYAIMFDDVGNRQLAGADKLSIKTKLVWVDQDKFFHIEYGPGQTTNERVTNNPLIISKNTSDFNLVDGIWTSFTSAVPGITELGLYSHGTSSNYFSNYYENVSGTSVVSTTLNNYPLMQIREDITTGIHQAVNNLNSRVTQYSDTLVNSTTIDNFRYIKPINGCTMIEILQFNSDNVQMCKYTVNFSTKTITLNQSNIAGINNCFVTNDQRLPGFYCVYFTSIQAINKRISEEVINILNTSGVASYTGDVTRGIDMYIGSTSNYSRMLGIPSISKPTTIPVSVTEATYRYDSSKFDKIKLENYMLADGTNGNSFMLDMEFSFNICQYTGTSLSTTTGSIAIGLVEHDFKNKSIRLLATVADKTFLPFITLLWEPHDKIRIRAFCDKWSNIPTAVKTYYSLSSLGTTIGACVVIYENLTKGAKVIQKSMCTGLYKTINILENICGTTTYGGVYVKKVIMYNKPLATDWVLE